MWLSTEDGYKQQKEPMKLMKVKRITIEKH